MRKVDFNPRHRLYTSQNHCPIGFAFDSVSSFLVLPICDLFGNEVPLDVLSIVTNFVLRLLFAISRNRWLSEDFIKRSSARQKAAEASLVNE